MPDVGKVTEEEMLNKIQSAKMHNDNMIVFVGTDSQTQGRFYNFITVVGLYTPGKGGTYFFTGEIEERRKMKGAQKLRMFDEQRSLLQSQHFFLKSWTFFQKFTLTSLLPTRKNLHLLWLISFMDMYFPRVLNLS